MGCCQGTFRFGNSGVQVWLLKSFWFSRKCVLYDFFIFFLKKLRYKKNLPNLIFSTLKWGAARVHSGVANLASKCDCSNSFGFPEMAFVIFSFFFSKIIDIKKLDTKTNRVWISQPYSGVLSGCIQKLQIWSPTMTAQILLVFEIWRFLWFFHVFFQILDIKKTERTSISQPYSGVLSG